MSELLAALVGGAIAGAASVVAVGLTNRHHRRLQRDQAVDAACARLMGAAWSVMLYMASKRLNQEVGNTEYHRMMAAAIEVIGRTRVHAPAFNKCIRELMRIVTDNGPAAAESNWDPQTAATVEIRRSLVAITGAAALWFESAHAFADGEVTASSLLSAIPPDQAMPDLDPPT